MGKTYNDSEAVAWRSRWAANYQPAISGMTNQKTLITNLAATFAANPSIDYVTNIITIQQINVGHRLVSAAFKYLIDGSNATILHDHIINQVQETGVDYSQYFGYGFTNNLNFSSWWANKFYLAYDYCRDLFSISEKATIDAWLNNAGKFFLGTDAVGSLQGVIPKRNADNSSYTTEALLIAGQASQTIGLWYYVRETNRNYVLDAKTGSIDDYTVQVVAKRDYSSFAGVGNTGALFSPTKYTHYDSSNVAHNEITQFGAYWNNTRATMSRLICYIGVELNEPMMIDHAKLFYEESLAYTVFPDGTACEYRRNGPPDSYVMQGTHTYWPLMVESYILIADSLLRNGYGDIFTYTTSGGRFGTEGGSKNLRLILETVIESCTSEVLRYLNSVSDANLLDTISNTDNRRFLTELILPIANKYYQEQRLEDAYMLTLAGSNPYSGTSILGVHPWGGALQAFPASAFLFHEMEDTEVHTPEKQIPKRMLL